MRPYSSVNIHARCLILLDTVRGTAVRFDSGSLELPPDSGLQGLTELTVEAWIMPFGLGRFLTLGDQRSGSLSVLLSSAHIELRTNWNLLPSYPERTTAVDAPIRLERFQHFALAIEADRCRLYIDGTPLDESDCGQPLLADPAHPAHYRLPFRLGRSTV